jgi:hypothetical protein
MIAHARAVTWLTIVTSSRTEPGGVPRAFSCARKHAVPEQTENGVRFGGLQNVSTHRGVSQPALMVGDPPLVASPATRRTWQSRQGWRDVLI